MHQLTRNRMAWGIGAMLAGLAPGGRGWLLETSSKSQRPRAAVALSKAALLSATPLIHGSWLVLGKGKAGLWTAVANAKGGGRPPRALPVMAVDLSGSAPLSCAASDARVWISYSPAGRRGGRVLVFRRRGGRFLGARDTAGPARVLGARGGLVYLAERTGESERLVARQERSFRVQQSWDLPLGLWEAAAFASPN